MYLGEITLSATPEQFYARLYITDYQVLKIKKSPSLAQGA